MNYSKVSKKECWIFLLINVYVGKDLKVAVYVFPLRNDSLIHSILERPHSGPE